MKIHWHNVPIYCTSIGFCFGNDLKAINGFISKYAGEDISADEESCCITLTAENGHKKYIIFLSELDNWNAMAHEVFHASLRILRDRGAYKEAMDDEQMAYLIGFITDLIMEDLKREVVYSQDDTTKRPKE